jgi:large subunit ribosomal protein L6
MSFKVLSLPQKIKIYIKKEENLILFLSDSGNWGARVPEKVWIEKQKESLIFRCENSGLDIFTSFYSVCKNIIQGISKKYSLILVLKGLGYRVQELKNGLMLLKLGFSHPVSFLTNSHNVEISSRKPTVLVLKSFSKCDLGNVSSSIRRFRMPDIYKGKGILLKNEKIFLKIGKKS